MQIVLRFSRAIPFLLVAVGGAYLYHLADQFDFVARAERAGPDLWPKIVIVLMLLAAVWGVIDALLASRNGDGLNLLVSKAMRAVGKEEEARHDLEAEAGESDQHHPLRAAAAIAALLAFVGAIGLVGFAVATFALMFTIILLAGYWRIGIATLISLLATLTFFFIFQRIAYLSLPLGVGPFKELSTLLMAIMGVR